MKDEFDTHDLSVIAIAQEDKDLKSHARFLGHFKDTPPWFPIVADLEQVTPKSFARTSSYLIDRKGIVQQVFPQVIHHRAHWSAILGEVKARRKAK